MTNYRHYKNHKYTLAKILHSNTKLFWDQHLFTMCSTSMYYLNQRTLKWPVSHGLCIWPLIYLSHMSFVALHWPVSHRLCGPQHTSFTWVLWPSTDLPHVSCVALDMIHQFTDACIAVVIVEAETGRGRKTEALPRTRLGIVEVEGLPWGGH